MLAVSLFLCGLRKLMLRSCGVQLSCLDAPTCYSSCASDLTSCLLWLARRVATVIRSVVDHVVCASRVPLVTRLACWCSCARHNILFFSLIFCLRCLVAIRSPHALHQAALRNPPRAVRMLSFKQSLACARDALNVGGSSPLQSGPSFRAHCNSFVFARRTLDAELVWPLPLASHRPMRLSVANTPIARVLSRVAHAALGRLAAYY
jgi:hypothetical protein